MPPSKATILVWLEQQMASPPDGVSNFLLLSITAIRAYMQTDLGPFWNQKEIGDEDAFNAWLQSEVDLRK